MKGLQSFWFRAFSRSRMLLRPHGKPRLCSSKFGSSCESVLANSAATRAPAVEIDSFRPGWPGTHGCFAGRWRIWPTHTASQWKRSWNFTRWPPSKDFQVLRWRSTGPSMDQMLLKNKRTSAEFGILKITWWFNDSFWCPGVPPEIWINLGESIEMMIPTWANREDCGPQKNRLLNWFCNLSRWNMFNPCYDSILWRYDFGLFNPMKSFFGMQLYIMICVLALTVHYRAKAQGEFWPKTNMIIVL